MYASVVEPDLCLFAGGAVPEVVSLSRLDEVKMAPVGDAKISRWNEALYSVASAPLLMDLQADLMAASVLGETGVPVTARCSCLALTK